MTFLYNDSNNYNSIIKKGSVHIVIKDDNDNVFESKEIKNFEN